MKKSRFIIALFATFFLASCATTKISYQEQGFRQTEPNMLNPYVIPTVADLNVSETKETVSSSFNNTLSESSFKSNEVERWKDIVLAKMMKEFNSDVIVAPIFDITTSNDLKTVTVELRGYPAKYTNFRNIQTSDSAAIRIHDVEIARPTITRYNNTGKVVAKTSKQKSLYKDQFSREEGLFVSPELGFNTGAALDGDNLMLDFQAIVGYQINNYIGIGGGTGFITYKINDFDKGRAISIPLLLNVNGFLFESKVTPYYSVDLGFMMPIKKAKHTMEIMDYETTLRSYVKGFTFSPEIGIALNKLRIGVEWKSLKSYSDSKSGGTVLEKTNEKANAFYLKVGFRF